MTQKKLDKIKNKKYTSIIDEFFMINSYKRNKISMLDILKATQGKLTAYFIHKLYNSATAEDKNLLLKYLPAKEIKNIRDLDLLKSLISYNFETFENFDMKELEHQAPSPFDFLIWKTQIIKIYGDKLYEKIKKEPENSILRDLLIKKFKKIENEYLYSCGFISSRERAAGRQPTPPDVIFEEIFTMQKTAQKNKNNNNENEPCL